VASEAGGEKGKREKRRKPLYHRRGTQQKDASFQQVMGRNNLIKEKREREKKGIYHISKRGKPFFGLREGGLCANERKKGGKRPRGSNGKRKSISFSG